MTAPSTGTQAPPADRSIADWVHIIHNWGQVQPDSPNYNHARAVMKAARTRLQDAVDAKNRGDQPSAPGTLSSALVNFGQGATAGLAQTGIIQQALGSLGGGVGSIAQNQPSPDAQDFQDYLWQARQAHPIASLTGELVGGAATGLATGPVAAAGRLGPLAAGAIMTGAPIGMQTGIETGSPIAGVAAGVAGAVAGGLGAKALSKIPLARNVGSRIFAKLFGTVPEASAVDAAEAGMRQTLQQQGLRAKEIEKIIEGERLRFGRAALQRVGAAPAPEGAAIDLEEASLRDKLRASNYGTPEQIDDLIKRWKAAKMTISPPVTTPQAAIRAEAFERAATEVPAMQPKPAALSAQARPQEVPLASQYRITVKQMEEHLGRELSAEERNTVAQRFSTPHPGHPFWLGPGAPTE